MIGDKEVYAGEVVLVSDRALLMQKEINAVIVSSDGVVRNIEKGIIQGVSIVGNDRAFLDILDVEGDGTMVRIPLEKINYAVEALNLIDRPITHNGHTGIVHSITMRSGIPWLNTDNGSISTISYLDFRGVMPE
jgi:hypothetical protein